MKAMQMNLSVLVKQPNRSFASVFLAFSLFRILHPHHANSANARYLCKSGEIEPPAKTKARCAEELARLSLQHPSLGLTKTASLLGYEDPNSFLRAFRMWEGVTPSEWRAMEKAGRSKRPPD
jgi:methylphosphotriester-DNA--protein-cysteine methyltransferase